MIYNTIIDDQTTILEFNSLLDELILNKDEHKNFDCIPISKNSYSIILNGKSYHMSINSYSNGYKVEINHHFLFIDVKDKFDIIRKKIGIDIKEPTHSGQIQAQIPGLVSQLFVKEGENVKLNQKLLTLEAMKMENEIISPVEGVVKNIFCNIGDNIEKGNTIMEINTYA